MKADILSVVRTASSERRAIVVLGMHRSGTSALSGLTCILGASPPRTLMPATADNPRGYWESMPVMLLSNEVLASGASAWDDWREFTADWYGSSECKELRARFREALQSEYQNTPLFVVKDPRLCRILPFFLGVLEDMAVQPVALLSLRDPLEVAWSLERRDKFPVAKSIALWLRHMLDAEINSRHLPRCIVSYENLLSDWRLEMGRAADEAGLAWPVDFDEAASAAGEFLTSELRNARSDSALNDERPELAFLAAEAYRLLCALSNDPSNIGLLAQIDVVRSKFNEASRFFGEILEPVNTEATRLRAGFDHASVEIARQRALLDHQVAQLVHFWSEIDAKAADGVRLSQELDANKRRLGELEIELVQFEAIQKEGESLRRALAAQEAENRALGAALAQRNEHIDGVSLELEASRDEANMLRRALAAQEAENRALGAELAQRNEHIDGVSLELEASRDEVKMLHRALAGQIEQNRQTTGELMALRTSRSWRLTAPYRAIGKLLRKLWGSGQSAQ